MVGKLVDAEEAERVARKAKFRMRKRIDKKLGKNTSKARNLVRSLKKWIDNLRTNLVQKNREKVEHLRETYLKTSKEKALVPEKLVRYSDAKIFTSENIDANDDTSTLLLIVMN